MLKRKLPFIIVVVVSICFVTFIDSKVYCVAKETKIERNEKGTKPTPAEEKPLANRAYDVNFFFLIVKAVFSLLIIIALIYFILRFLLKGQRWITKQQKFIQTIGTHSLTPNKYIQIIEIGNKLLVLGISEHNINLLTEIEDKEVIDFIKTQSSKEEDKISLSFIQHLKKRLQGQQIPHSDYEDKLKFLNKQRQRLKKLES
jgi:flagellar protein FliO/FliZ